MCVAYARMYLALVISTDHRPISRSISPYRNRSFESSRREAALKTSWFLPTRMFLPCLSTSFFCAERLFPFSRLCNDEEECNYIRGWLFERLCTFLTRDFRQSIFEDFWQTVNWIAQVIRTMRLVFEVWKQKLFIFLLIYILLVYLFIHLCFKLSWNFKVDN